MLRTIYSGNISHPTLIALLFIMGGVKVAEDEEKSLKASPVTLKAPVEGKEVERIRKRRRI